MRRDKSPDERGLQDLLHHKALSYGERVFSTQVSLPLCLSPLRFSSPALAACLCMFSVF